MTKNFSMCDFAAQRKAALEPTEFREPTLAAAVPRNETWATTPAPYPPLVGAPACNLTEQEWQRINDGMYLTARELDVVKGIMVGESEASIAAHLGISINTVHTHLGRVYKKLGVRSAATLILRVFAAYVQAMRPKPMSDMGSVSPK